jgi:hypothetical protein
VFVVQCEFIPFCISGGSRMFKIQQGGFMIMEMEPSTLMAVAQEFNELQKNVVLTSSDVFGKRVDIICDAMIHEGYSVAILWLDIKYEVEFSRWDDHGFDGAFAHCKDLFTATLECAVRVLTQQVRLAWRVT